MKEPQKTMTTRIRNRFLRTADLPGEGHPAAKKLHNPAPNPFFNAHIPRNNDLLITSTTANSNKTSILAITRMDAMV
ncbi:hypothetical protein HDF12_003984 [Edaphobacter lichenicola]|uniref:Uncharacterized protein n=1 Tax=Tunturiibacter lichenicola TaxID=2051959 RepID=A0A7Y9NRI7_9BACT|nr:hypothetical protein [Edaphobacter lichenicola]